MVKSIFQANTIELHYWMDDNSHIIDANIQNKCERELLDILDSIAGQWGLSVTIETMPLANGGVIRWFRLKAKSFKRALNYIYCHRNNFGNNNNCHSDNNYH